MSDDRLPVERPEDTLVFDHRVPSPLVRRGLDRLEMAVTARQRIATAARRDTPPELLWSFAAPDGVCTRVDADADTVVVAYHEVRADGEPPDTLHVLAFDARTGNERWRRVFRGRRAFWTVANGFVYLFDQGVQETFYDVVAYELADMGILAEDGTVSALDAATGTEQWHFRIEGHGRLRLDRTDLDRGTIYVRSVYLLHAVDARTGAERWQIDSEASFWDGWEPQLEFYADFALAVGHFPGALVAFDPTTGIERWRCTPERKGGWMHDEAEDAWWSVEVRDDVAYVSRDPYSLCAIDTRTGGLRWSVAIVGGRQPSISRVEGRLVYVRATPSSGGGSLVVAFETETGAERWCFQTDDSDSYPSLTIANDEAYITGHGVLYALDATSGAERWHSPIEGLVSHLSLTMGNGKVYVDGKDVLYALDAISGAVRWRFRYGFNCSCSLLVLEDRVYLQAFTNPLDEADAPEGTVVLDATTEEYVGNYADHSLAGARFPPDAVEHEFVADHVSAFYKPHGSWLWSFRTGPVAQGNSPVVMDGVLYVARDDDYLFGLDAATGTERWSFKVEVEAAVHNEHGTAPTVANHDPVNVVCLTVSSAVYALRRPILASASRTVSEIT